MQTGSGFIKMEESNTNSSSSSNGSCFRIASDANVNAWDEHASSKGNPATNDWTPSAQTQTVAIYFF